MCGSSCASRTRKLVVAIACFDFRFLPVIRWFDDKTIVLVIQWSCPKLMYLDTSGTTVAGDCSCRRKCVY